MATIIIGMKICDYDSAITQTRTKKFLSSMKSVVILSLAKACLVSSGKVLVHKLLARKNSGACPWISRPLIRLGLRFNDTPSSLVTEVVGRGNAFAVLEEWAGREFAMLPIRLKRLNKSVDIEEHGTASFIRFPVWSDTPELCGDLNSRGFKACDLDILIDRLILGSFSLTRENKLFYCPLHLEIVHEVIHVLHNFRGTNRARLSLSCASTDDQLRGIWKDAEEYWTIQGGKLTENNFNIEMGLPLRYGHSGMAICKLIPQLNPTAYIPPGRCICSVL